MLAVDTPWGVIRFSARATGSLPTLTVGPHGEMPAWMYPTPARAVLRASDAVMRRIVDGRPRDEAADAVAWGPSADALPEPGRDDDLREAVARHYGLGHVPGRRELEDLAEVWRPWRGVAAHHLVAEPVPAGRAGDRPLAAPAMARAAA